MLDPTHIDALRSIVGDRGLLTAPEDMVSYETGARYDRGRAAVVLRPATTQEVSRLVSYCVRTKIHLIPQSGNTGVVAGSTPDASGLQAVISLDRLTGTIEVDRLNKSVRAGAGLRLSDLNARLEQDGLFFPIDLGADPRLGGMLSTNTGGSRFIRYGDMRRNTLGLTVVLADADGSVLHLGDDLRKNNTGVDWKQLFIGTFGTFGIITECRLTVEAAPKYRATALLVPSSPDRVPEILLELEQRFGSFLTAFESLSGNAIRAALDHVPSLRNPFAQGAVPDLALLIEISSPDLPDASDAWLNEALEHALASQFERELLSDALLGSPQDLWALRHALSEGVKNAGKLVAFDLAFRRGDVLTFRARMATELPVRYPGATLCDFGHVGDGGVHFNLVFPAGDARFDDIEFEQALRHWVLSIVVNEFGGSYSAEHGIGRKNQGFYDMFTSPQLRDLSGKLKSILSPGAIGSVTL